MFRSCSKRDNFCSINLNDGDQKFIVYSGTVLMPRGLASTDEPHEASATPGDLYYMVSIVTAQTDSNAVVKARMSHTLNVLSSVAYSQPMPLTEALEQQSTVEAEAIAVSFQLMTISTKLSIRLGELCNLLSHAMSKIKKQSEL